MSKVGAIATRQVLAARAESAAAMNPDALEDAIVSAFAAKPHRARYRDGLSNPKTRGKLLSRLHHHVDDLDHRYRLSVSTSCHTVDDLLVLLKARGAPDLCFLVSSSRELDRQVMPLRSALTSVVGYGMGTLVSCIPGTLAYYEGEGPNDRWLLERPAG